MIVVEVYDGGPGLTDKERAFEPFYSTKQNGMGIGLAICRSIIQAHEGELWARDNAPRGTIFAFTLRPS
jgi:signal transduction histidine kinase